MKKYFVIIAILVVVSTSFSSKAHATAGLMSFGGQVTVVVPCDSGLLVYLKTFYGVQPFMWTTGELPYLMHVVPHPGQYMLGSASYTMAPCVFGIFTIGEGFPIIFHGSSL